MKKLIGLLSDSSLFRKCYIVCLFFTMISYVSIGAYTLLTFLVIWGVVLTFKNAIKNKAMVRMRYALWLFAFLTVAIISVMLHFGSGLFFNIALLFHYSICFFIFYGMHTEKGFDMKKEVFFFARFFVYATSIIGIVGFLFLCFGIYFEFGGFKFIIFDNRFTGLYANPNYLGFASGVTLVFIHMLTKKDFVSAFLPKRVRKRILIPAICINVMSLFLCDSNTSLVFICSYVIFICVVGLFKKSPVRHTRKQVTLKIFSNLFVIAVTFALLVGLRIFAQSISSLIVNATSSVVPPNVGIFQSVDQITFTHKNTSLDSGRVKLLRQGLDVFTNNPFFGIGRGNLYEYGKKYLSSGFAFSNNSVKALAPFSTDLHNGYLTILVSHGIIGFSIFAIFGIKFAKHFIHGVFTDPRAINNDILPSIFAFLCAYLLLAFAEKALLCDISFMVVIFWLFMGYASCYLVKYEPKHSQEYNSLLHKLLSNK